MINANDIPNGSALLLVDLATDEITELEVPASPMGVVITPDGKQAFTANHGGSTMTVVDLVARKSVEDVEIGGSPEELAVRPDGEWAVVNTDANESIRFFKPSDPSGTLTAPLLIGGDPDATAFVPSEGKLVIAQSLPTATGQPGYSIVDVSDPTNASVLEKVLLPPDPGAPYGSDVIPGTTHVLVTIGIAGCELRETDVSVAPSNLVRKIKLPCVGTSLPLQSAIDAEGKHAFVGAPGDNSLMVVDLDTGDVERIPWLDKAGPMHVAIAKALR